MKLSELAPYEVAMLFCGVILFLVAIALILYATAKKRPPTHGIALVSLAILMIGFPGIKSFKGLGVEVNAQDNKELKEKNHAVENNAEDKQAVEELKKMLADLEKKVTPETAPPATAETIAESYAALGETDNALKWATAAVQKAPQSESARKVLARVNVARLVNLNANKPLTTEARSNLNSAAIQLSKYPDLSSAAQVTLAKAQLTLGQTNSAQSNLQKAVTANKNLKVSPELLRSLKIAH